MKKRTLSLLLSAVMALSMFAVPCAAAPTFSDVSENDWYYDAVISSVDKHLFSGVSDSKFAPDMKMDRAMMVTVLAAMEFGVRGAPKSDSPFTDLTADWYKNAVAWAYTNKITTGISDTEFSPHSVLTREQVAVFLLAYARRKGIDVSVGEDTNILSYHDAFEISAWAFPAMQWACGAGLMGGNADGNLLPSAPATRAQVAVILNNFSKLVND